jgi:hypothetical protein
MPRKVINIRSTFECGVLSAEDALQALRIWCFIQIEFGEMKLNRKEEKTGEAPLVVNVPTVIDPTKWL